MSHFGFEVLVISRSVITVVVAVVLIPMCDGEVSRGISKFILLLLRYLTRTHFVFSPM